MKNIIFSNMEMSDDYDRYDEAYMLEDERTNLDIPIDGKILVIADLGLWNGRRNGYKILPNNISEILYDADAELVEWYDDGYNIKCTAVHHDGTNYYEYREIRDGVNIDNLLNSIRNNESYSRKKLNTYTKSIRPYVLDVYGWE